MDREPAFIDLRLRVVLEANPPAINLELRAVGLDLPADVAAEVGDEHVVPVARHQYDLAGKVLEQLAEILSERCRGEADITQLPNHIGAVHPRFPGRRDEAIRGFPPPPHLFQRWRIDPQNDPASGLEQLKGSTSMDEAAVSIEGMLLDSERSRKTRDRYWTVLENAYCELGAVTYRPQTSGSRSENGYANGLCGVVGRVDDACAKKAQVELTRE